ncbi:hypothetical protein COHA_001058 [Chlorella ohadii]|uniref:dolichol kinase n=1 Tax=Chlorella ohadii TaxID=2649997 RepID=A0AAD5DYF5_9CHLO|nr:hypothetical protein COHA_001058 [Chlorella ohadii]
MMLRSRAAAEAAVCLATHAVLGAALWSAWRGTRHSDDLDQLPGYLLPLLAFMALAPLAVAVEAAVGSALVVALAAVAAAISDGLPNAATLLAAAAVAAGCQHALLVGLPGVFTAGEAMVAAEAAVLLLGSVLQSLQQGAGAAQQQAGSYTLFVLLLTAGSVAAAALLFPLLLSRQRAAVHKPGSRHRTAHGAAAAAAVVALLAAVAAVPAALWAVRLALSSRRRLLVCGWWAGALGAALPIMGWLSGSGRMRGILVRKGYHLLAVALFLPALLAEPQLLGVALAAAWAVLLAVEAARLSGLPGISPAIHRFMTAFTDARDSGPILITHFTLLLGMAAPVWLSNALSSDNIGSSLEGGAGGQPEHQQPLWLAAHAGIMILGATALSCLLEGVTTQLDNVFMPLHYFALLLCL